MILKEIHPNHFTLSSSPCVTAISTLSSGKSPEESVASSLRTRTRGIIRMSSPSSSLVLIVSWTHTFLLLLRGRTPLTLRITLSLEDGEEEGMLSSIWCMTEAPNLVWKHPMLRLRTSLCLSPMMSAGSLDMSLRLSRRRRS